MKYEKQKVIKNNDLNSYTKTKLAEEMEKTNKLIDKVEKSIANHDEELNKKNVELKVLGIKGIVGAPLGVPLYVGGIQRMDGVNS